MNRKKHMLLITGMISICALLLGCAASGKKISMEQLDQIRKEADDLHQAAGEPVLYEFYYAAGSVMSPGPVPTFRVMKAGDAYYYTKGEDNQTCYEMSDTQFTKLMDIIEKYDLKSWVDPEDAPAIADGSNYYFMFVMTDQTVTHVQGAADFQRDFYDMEKEMDDLFGLGIYAD